MINSVVIVCNGTDYKDNKVCDWCSNADYIICADGALNLLHRLRITPDLILGDMDSVDHEVLSKYAYVKQEEFPPEKDYTDSELAIEKAYALNPRRIILIAAIGDYFDHSLANAINLCKYYKEEVEFKIVTGNAEIFPVFTHQEIFNKNNHRFSMFPVGNVTGLNMDGFKYKFKSPDISLLDYSVSNVIISNKAAITIKNGMLLCVLFDKGFE